MLRPRPHDWLGPGLKGCLPLLLAATAAAQSDPSNFATVIDLPPDMAPSSVGSGTQVNVLEGGALGQNFDAGSSNNTSSNVEINVLGGVVGGNADFYAGSTLNLQSGEIGTGLDAHRESELNVYGGEIEGFLRLRQDAELNLFDGRLNQLVALPGSTVNMHDGSILSQSSQLGSAGAVSQPPAVLNMSGGFITSGFDAYEDSLVNMSGGLIQRGFTSHHRSVVNLSGGRIYWYYDLEGELNMTGGSIGLGFEALDGAVVNASGGYFESSIEIDSGATVNLAGTPVTGGVLARDGSVLRLSGGSFGDGFRLENGAVATFVGGDFQIDGQPVAGLAANGDRVTQVVPEGSVLSGTFTDGTPFAFTTGDQDLFSEVTFEVGSLPAIGATVVNASSDSVPLGVRSGQTLNVDDGSVVSVNFVAGPGSTLNVLDGGRLRQGAKAIGAVVNVTGGQVDTGFDAMLGSTVEVSGGTTSRIEVFDGSVLRVSGSAEVGSPTIKDGGQAELSGGRTQWLFIEEGGAATMTGGQLVSSSQNLFFNGGTFDVSGGQFAGPFSSLGGGKVRLSGGDFFLDGEPVAIGPSGATPIDVPDGSVFTGVLADGSPFAFSSLKVDRLGAASLVLVAAPLPEIETDPIVVTGPAEITGLRGGQTMIIEDGGSVGDHFVLQEGASIELRGGGYVGNGAVLVGAELIAEAGGAGSLTLLAESELIVRGTGETGSIDLYGSRLQVSEDGSVFYTTLRDGSHARITGGEASVGGRGYPIEVESGSSIEFAGDARTSGIELQAGATGVIAGGSFDHEVDALAGAELEIIAIELLIDGAPIADLDPGESLLWTERTGVLSGVFANGLEFEFDLTATTNPFRSDYFDPAALLTLTRVLPGDFDRNGVVDAADHARLASDYGATVEVIGEGADGNYDGIVNAADYTIWRDALASSSTAVPEPAALVMTLLLAGVGYRAR